jgi:GDP-L-fucose synthase
MRKDSKIFVAGGTGLVGSAILRKLSAKGYSNLVANSHKRVSQSEISKIAKFTPLDLTNQTAVADFFSREKPEFVFLAAAKVGGIIANNTYRAEFIYNNLQIQNNIIHQSYLNNVKKLMFLGSSCIYPRDCPQPIKEEYLLTSPLEYTNEAYSIAKIAGIRMCESYNIQFGTNYISVMPTNLYGPNDNYDLEASHVLAAHIRKIHLARLLQRNEKEELMQNLSVNSLAEAKEILILNGISKNSVTLWGTGTPRREFLYSDDMADATVFIMNKIDFKDTIEGKREVRNTHINIGTGKDITIKELAQIVCDIVGFDGKILWDSTKPDGMMQKLLDVSKLHNFGWKNKTALRDGIALAYNAYKEHQHN